MSQAPDTPDIERIVRCFAADGAVQSVAPLAGGHIHSSYRVVMQRPGGVASAFVLQRINRRIFRDVASLMENMQRVTAHLARRMRDEGLADLERRVLRLVPARGGAVWHEASDGSAWRMLHYMGGMRTFERVDSPKRAEQAARAFGAFARRMSSLPPPRLHETIAHFHDTPRRFAALDEAVAADVCGRAAQVRAEIGAVMAERSWSGVIVDALRSGVLPERVAHYDAKLSNVLFDAASGEARCVIDLDTVMPGTPLLDFGDMVRSMCCEAAEDEPDASRVRLDERLLEALTRGYLAEAGDLLTPAERNGLLDGARVMVLEQAVRFLDDYLRGDVYFATQRAGQNLDRCRVQLALLCQLRDRRA